MFSWRCATALLLFSIGIANAQNTTAWTPPMNDDVCQPMKGWSKEQTCDYVNDNDDICEGGGYPLWSQYVACAGSTTAEVFVIIGGCIYMLFMFVMISTAADDFFSPNVAAIVAHLKISESVAGVTFMAFGNGAPDIFGSIASVLSTPKPKAGLALGELLGAGIFVTTMVTATIVMTSSFEADAFSTIRDLLFYIVALGWILFVFLYANTVSVWEPAVYLGMYAVYVVTVIIGQQLHKRKRKQQRGSSRYSTHPRNSVAPINPVITISSSVHSTDSESGRDTIGSIEAEEIKKAISNKRFSIFPPAMLPNMFGNGQFDEKIKLLLAPIRKAQYGTVTVKNKGEDDEEDEDFIVLHNHVYLGDEARSRAASMVPSIPATELELLPVWKRYLLDLWMYMRPLGDMTEFKEGNVFEKTLEVLKIIPVIGFKATIPMSENVWSQPIAVMNALCGPMVFLFCIKCINLIPFDHSPGLWLYALCLSAIMIILIVVFTSINDEPKYFKSSSSYLGFLMAIGWIYFIANEVVSVVTMIGLVTKLSHEVLGLTILAWSNSIGDLIADVSVVKQGFPRMAMAAAIGGPLFNLLMGFGIPFLIAKLRGNTVTIYFTPIYHILILFLGISLCTSLIALFVQRFYLRRPYAFVLMGIYASFLVMVILTETNVVVWGNPNLGSEG